MLWFYFIIREIDWYFGKDDSFSSEILNEETIQLIEEVISYLSSTVIQPVHDVRMMLYGCWNNVKTLMKTSFWRRVLAGKGKFFAGTNVSGRDFRKYASPKLIKNYRPSLISLIVRFFLCIYRNETDTFPITDSVYIAFLFYGQIPYKIRFRKPINEHQVDEILVSNRTKKKWQRLAQLIRLQQETFLEILSCNPQLYPYNCE